MEKIQKQFNTKTFFGDEWADKLQPILSSEYFRELMSFLGNERLKKSILPPVGDGTIFRAFRETPYSKVKVVILGQDPYPQKGIFDGLAFSNKENQEFISPSLENILKEIERCSNDVLLHQSPDLTRWAKQGVLLLNVAHTVVEGKPLSHINLWKDFTGYVLRRLNSKDQLVWLLWGNKAHEYTTYIDNKSHVVIKSGHPSPLNQLNPFYGCNCFIKANKYLRKFNKAEINW